MFYNIELQSSLARMLFQAYEEKMPSSIKHPGIYLGRILIGLPTTIAEIALRVSAAALGGIPFVILWIAKKACHSTLCFKFLTDYQLNITGTLDTIKFAGKNVAEIIIVPIMITGLLGCGVCLLGYAITREMRGRLEQQNRLLAQNAERIESLRETAAEVVARNEATRASLERMQGSILTLQGRISVAQAVSESITIHREATGLLDQLLDYIFPEGLTPQVAHNLSRPIREALESLMTRINEFHINTQSAEAEGAAEAVNGFRTSYALAHGMFQNLAADAEVALSATHAAVNTGGSEATG